MSELELRISYDHEGCFARIYSGDSLLASAYAYAIHGGWMEARDEAIAAVKVKHQTMTGMGEQPAPETIAL